MAAGLRIDRRTAIERLLFVILALIPVWAAGPFPTYDGPQHTFAGYLLNHIEDPGLGFGRYLDLQVSYSALFSPILTAFFERLWPLRTAVKCVLTVIVLIQMFGLLWLLEAVDSPHSPWRWFAPVFPYSYLFYMGFDNYSAALGLGLCALALMLSLVWATPDGHRSRWWGWGRVGGLLLLACMSHAFAACLIGLTMGLILVGSCRGRSTMGDLIRLAAVSLPALALAGMVAYSASGSQHDPIWHQIGLHGSALLWLPRNLYDTPYGMMWWANLVPLAAVLFLVVGLLRWEPPVRGTTLAVVTLLGLLMLFPENVDAWAQVPIRFAGLLTALVLLGGAIGTRRLGRFRPWLSAAMLVLSLTSIASITQANLRLSGLQREFEAGIGQVPIPAFRRAYFREGSPNPARPDSYIAANLHVYYMIDEGCLFPYVFRNRPEAHLLRETKAWHELETPDSPGFRRLPEAIRWQLQARLGLYYDEVMLWDPLRDQFDAFRQLGYQELFSRGRLFRLAPVHRRLRLLVTTPRPGRFVADVVFSDLLWPYTRCVFDLGDKDAGKASCELVRLPSTLIGLQVSEWSSTGPQRRVCSLRVDLSHQDGEVDLDPCLSETDSEVQ